MKTTFEKIKSFYPCEEGCEKFIKYHNPESLEGEVLIRDILKSNGIKDAAWALRAADDQDKVRLFCVDIAESVLHIFENKYPTDKRPRKAIEAIRKFVKKEISREELNKAAYAADDAAADAYTAAAAVCTAYYAACAAYYAAYDTADDANAYAAADDAVRACAGDDIERATKKWQEIEQILLKYI